MINTSVSVIIIKILRLNCSVMKDSQPINNRGTAKFGVMLLLQFWSRIESRLKIFIH